MKKTAYLITVLLGTFILAESSCVVYATGVLPNSSVRNEDHNDSYPLRRFYTLSPSIYRITSKASANEMVNKKFIFSLVVHPEMSGFTMIPPVGLYFEKGIKSFASLGLALGAELQNESSIDYSAAVLGISARACGYVLPIIAAASKNDIKTYGFEPYAGLQGGYFLTAIAINGGDPLTSNDTRFGVLVGTRWYPGDKRGFALLAEFSSVGNTGRGNSFNIGISLGR